MDISNNCRIERIYNYKDLIQKANRYGFNYSRSKGDHIIFTHRTTKKHIVIPAHTISKGLSIKIQKQIFYLGGIL